MKRRENNHRPGGVRPQSEAERVQGQIACGEVRAGPDAAREIAAEHEDAYGDVWSRRGRTED